MKAIIAIALATLMWTFEARAEASQVECAPSAGDARFRLFRTEKMWTLLKLVTRTGRLWQVQAAVDGDRMKSVINSVAIEDDGKNGRYTLCPTGNMWTFVLLDQDTGRTWQIQYGMSPGERGVVGEITIPVDPPPAGD
jgi:hypothetical protein